MTILIFILFIVSLFFWLNNPQQINSFYGYRTKKSMASISNWKMANKYCSKLMLLVFSILLTLSLIIDFTSFNLDLLLKILSILSLILIIYLTENKLKKNGNKNELE